MENLVIKHEDELDVLSFSKKVMQNPKFVKINYEELNHLTMLVKERLDKGLPTREEEFYSFGNLEDDAQLVFLENVVNHCFWAEKGKEKWIVEHNGVTEDGSLGLRVVFERAIEEGVPILEPKFLQDLTLEQVKQIFRPKNGIEIPLLEERMNNLREAGKVLLEKYNGKYATLVKEAEFDAIKIAKLTIENFPSFDDVGFYKRAQLNAYDIWAICNDVKNTDKLTAMADYKLPQIIREYKAIEYDKELANKLDSYELIEAGSQEELEIRAATVWVCEIISEELSVSAGLVDRAIWWLGREVKAEHPYHRTYTIFY